VSEARALPRLDLVDHRSPFDEALIVIDGREEDTIRIECQGAAELAARLVDFVNSRELIIRTLTAAAHALRSYEYDNASPELARSVAHHCETLTSQIGAAA